MIARYYEVVGTALFAAMTTMIISGTGKDI